MAWRPLSARGGEASEKYDALHDGIPEWLKASVWGWIQKVLAILCETTQSDMAQLVGGYDPNEENYRSALLMIERELRLTLNWSSVDAARKSLLQQAVATPRVGLDVIDFLLNVLSGTRHGALAKELNGILAQGGSKWCVSAAGDSLEERVQTEVAERAKKLMTAGTRTAAHLREAWHGVYGRNPNPGHAYGEAVKAVEAAAIPVICPNDTAATLGRIIGTMKASPHQWKIALQPSAGSALEHVIGAIELLWKSQLDRHGTPDPSAPFSATREEAEAAVHLALTLTHWFQSGAIRRI